MEALKTKQLFVAGYNGANMMAAFVIPGEEKPYVFAELHTLSYSIHREKRPVRVLGTPDPVGFTYGARTIAGTLIFASLDEHMVRRAMQAASKRYPRLVADQLPPFHIAISLADELGHRSRITIYNCSIVDEGQVFSVDQLVTETTMSYIATSIDHMRNMEDAGEHAVRQSVTVPLSVPTAEERVLLGGMVASNQGVDVSGIKIIANGPGYRLETFTRSDGTFLLYVPKRLGEIRLEGYRGGHFQYLDTRQTPEPIIQPRRVYSLQPDQQTVQLGIAPIDLSTLRIWVNGEELARPSATYPHTVNEVLGIIRFERPLSPDDVVEAAFTAYDNFGGGIWQESPVEASGVTGRVVDQAGQPISGAVVQLETVDGTTVATATGEDGMFTFEAPQTRMTHLTVWVDGRRRFAMAIPEEDAERLDLGEIMLVY